MGTNYYLVKNERPPCPCCERTYVQERLHIGKSSGGWCFALHVIPEMGMLLIDSNPKVAGVWDYLIRASAAEICSLRLLGPDEGVWTRSALFRRRRSGWWDFGSPRGEPTPP